MPAQNLHRSAEEGIYSHIYNKGIEKRVIFSDEEDIRVFEGFLKDYLSAPLDPESIKKVFTVNGKDFRGTPHQPKNYVNKVELISYCIMPDHFHLLLHQKTHGALESFIRSLCTRYSIYFNKKYQHSGALFQGPYKSVQVQDRVQLLHLTRFFHYAGGTSSYPEYLGLKDTEWVKPGVILSFFETGTHGYKEFMENYELGQKERQLIEGMTLEHESDHLERRDLSRNKEILPGLDIKPSSNTPHLFAISIAVFILLFTLGMGNIKLSAMKDIQPPPQTPEVLSEAVSETISDSINPSQTPSIISETELVREEVIPKATESAKPSNPNILVVKLNDQTATVNIRTKPSTDSEIIGLAKDGDIYEFLSSDSGWYEVKLSQGSGFIFSTAFEEGQE